MSPDIIPIGAPSASDTITVDQAEAARLTKLSAKTLGRLADAGEPVGRIKVNRRVLYIRAYLERWLESQLPEYADQKRAALGTVPSAADLLVPHRRQMS